MGVLDRCCRHSCPVPLCLRAVWRSAIIMLISVRSVLPGSYTRLLFLALKTRRADHKHQSISDNQPQDNRQHKRHRQYTGYVRSKFRASWWSDNMQCDDLTCDLPVCSRIWKIHNKLHPLPGRERDPVRLKPETVLPRLFQHPLLPTAFPNNCECHSHLAQLIAARSLIDQG